MDFDLSSKHLEIQNEAKSLTSRIEPLANEADELSDIHPTVLALLRKSGLVELMVPSKYGGRNEQLDPLSICLVREIFAGTSCQLDSLFAMQGIGSFAITATGSPDQCKKWLPTIRSLDSLAALALSVAFYGCGDSEYPSEADFTVSHTAANPASTDQSTETAPSPWRMLPSPVI